MVLDTLLTDAGLRALSFYDIVATFCQLRISCIYGLN